MRLLPRDNQERGQVLDRVKNYGMRLSITKQIALLLSLSLTGALMGTGVFYVSLSRTHTEALFVEIAGDQSLRAAQLHDYARMVHSGQEADREGLSKLVAEFDQALRLLAGEGPTKEGEALFYPPELEDELAEVIQLWGEYKSSLLLIAARPADDPQTDRAYAFIESTALPLMEAADQLVDDYIIVNRRLEQRVFLFLGVVVGLDTLLLLLGIWTIRNYVAERRQVEEAIRVNLAVQQVREAILQMKNPEDWSGVGMVLRHQLGDLVAYDGAGITIVNRQCRSFYAYALCEFGVLRGELCEFLPRALEQAIASGKSVLRRNRAEIEEWGDNIGPERNSVVDVPFGKGTLSLNSVRENAFNGQDIAVLERFAGVIAEAYLRLVDLQHLKRLAAIVEESTDVIGMCDPRGWMLYLNRAGRRMVGVGENEDITLTRATDYLPEPLHSLISTIASQGAWQGEGVLCRRDGSEFPVMHTALAHRDMAGKVEVISTIAHDISGRQQAEKDTRVALALQRVRNEVLLMRGVEGWRKVVAIFEGELRTVIEFEDCGINLLDRQRHSYLDYESATGTIIEKIYETLPRSLAQALDTGAPVYRRNRAEMDQFEDPIPPGRNCVLDVPFAGGTIAINSPEENAFSEHDIEVLELFAQMMSEGYRRLEDLQNLALQGEQLHQAQKMEAIGQLATGVAHEINNPLTSVLGYSELLLRRELDPQVRAHLETIRQEGERAREIAARLLQFVRRQKANTQFLSLTPLVQEILALVRQQFELDHVQLTSALAPDLPLVQANPGQIQQLLLALLQNSREAIKKAGKAGVVEVHTRRQGAQIQLVVEDNGPGIPEPIRERVFEPFFTTKEVGSAAGSGMGLSLCYAIAREHGGQLWAEPRTAGACLVLGLPVRTDAVESLSAEKEQDEH